MSFSLFLQDILTRKTGTIVNNCERKSYQKHKLAENACRLSHCNVVQKYCTRFSPFNFVVNACNTDLHKYFISHQGVMLWNSLPSDVKQCVTLAAFKQLARNHIFGAYN